MNFVVMVVYFTTFLLKLYHVFRNEVLRRSAMVHISSKWQVPALNAFSDRKSVV
jgi:hypothetical protein